MSEPVQAPAPPAVLDRAAILGLCLKRAPKVEAVELPGGGTVVHVCVMDGFALDSWQDGNYELDKESGELVPKVNARGRLAARTLCDAAGTRLFQDAEAEHLGRMDGPTLDAICKAARKLNCLDAEAKKEKEKNSPTPEATAASG